MALATKATLDASAQFAAFAPVQPFLSFPLIANFIYALDSGVRSRV